MNKPEKKETELVIPSVLARLEESLFRALPNDLAETWPRRFLASTKVGANLEMVWPKFAIWLLTDDEHGVIKFAKTKEQYQAIQSVADLYVLKIEGADIDVNDWVEARSAAYAAYAAYVTYPAAFAAYAAADSAAADSAVDSAADSATYAAYAAYAATDTAAYAAYVAAGEARVKTRIAQSKKLLELLKKCQ